jgi:hypothetical protein
MPEVSTLDPGALDEKPFLTASCTEEVNEKKGHLRSAKMVSGRARGSVRAGHAASPHKR